MINIAFADDHVMLRKGVAEILSQFDGISVTIEACNGRELIDKIRNSDNLPHLCILDINMPVMDGYDTAKAIRREWPEMDILALSMHDGELNIINMLRCGASGYVLKNAEPEELYNAILTIREYGFYHSDIVSDSILSLLNEKRQRKKEISGRELEFLAWACSEYTYKEIADKMKVSFRAVDGYREHLFKKLGISSRTGLVLYAMKSGVIIV